MRITFFAEKESVAKAGRAVWPGGTWVAGQGHLLNPLLPRKGDNNYFNADALPYLPGTLPIAVIRETAHKLAAAVKAIAGADRVVMAVDWDREGTKIGAEVLGEAGWTKPVDYINTSDATPKALKREIEKALRGDSHRDRFVRWSLEADCRQYEDYLVGVNATQLATLILRPAGESGVWGSGPVQTAIVGLVRRRELEIERFKPTEYFEIKATIETEKRHRCELVHAPAEADRIMDRATADAIVEAARKFTGALRVETKSGKVMPPKLYDLPHLQSAAARRWGWSPTKTLDVAQSLYEPGGPQLLTYPRGEGSFLPEEHVAFIADKLSALAKLAALKDILAPVIRNRSWIVRTGTRYNTRKVLGHHAIVPTDEDPSAKHLSSDQQRLYELIAMNFAANHLDDAVVDRTEIAFDVASGPKSRTFKATGTIQRSPGWRAVYGGRGDDDDEGEAALPPIAHGENARALSAGRSHCRTRPPKPYTLGSMVIAMCRLIDMVEDPEVKAALKTDNPDAPMGLGTPATRDSHIAKVIEERGYLEKLRLKGSSKDPVVATTELGRRYYDRWLAAWPDLVDPVSRARTEFRLRLVADEDVSLAENRARAERYRKEVRDRVGAMVAAVKAKAPAIAAAAGPRPPSQAMLKAAEARAQEKGIALPPAASRDIAACKAFLDANPRSGESSALRPASEAQLSLARRIASEKNVALPEGLDARAISKWIDDRIGKREGKGASVKPSRSTSRRPGRRRA